MELVRLVASIPLFKGLLKGQLDEIVNSMADQTFDRGQAVLLEGEPAEGFFVLVQGRVKIFKISSEGKEQILHFVSPGESFGEVPMFAGDRFPANAETIEKSRIFFFPRAAFLELIKNDPSLAMNMLAELSGRLRQMTRLVEELSLKEVPGRLAAYILLLSSESGQDDVELDITKGQLASLLGTIPETLSRILGKMNSQGVISVNGRKLRILDRAVLEDLASGGKSTI
ncbi:MAG TPA: Crp/Fnr family transcriptional regulator [Dissulfurispiraceae bacterium]|nr:Crp/Fnr family transcriptional regulator [Dissulfurispiraceae bacterium]